MIILYILEGNIFVVIVCKFLVQKKILKYLVKDCFKTNGKQMIKMSKKVEHVLFKSCGRKIKLPFMIYVDFESVLVSEDNGKQNSDESYTSKYQKHVACSYGYKLKCVDDQFSELFRFYLDEDAVYNLF